MRTLVNFVAFQLGWLGTVLGGAHQRPWLGVGLVAVIAAAHLRLAARPAVEARLLLAAAAIGTLWDGLLVSTGLLVYPSGLIVPWLPPVWIIALWVLFATLLNLSLRWLRGRWALAAICGALGGPLAFYGGARLGGVAFADPLVALALIGAGWAVLTPLLVWLAARFDGQVADPGAASPADAARGQPYPGAASRLAEADRHA